MVLYERKFSSTSCGTVTWRIADGTIQILLIKQRNSDRDWGLPKGKMRSNESYSDCALRETLEETGVVVELHQQLQSISVGAKRYIFFVAKPVGSCDIDQTHPDNETANAAWVDITSCPNLTYHSQVGIARSIIHILDDQEAEELWFTRALNKLYNINKKLVYWPHIRSELKKLVGSAVCNSKFSKVDSITKHFIPTPIEQKLIEKWGTLIGEPVILFNAIIR